MLKQKGFVLTTVLIGVLLVFVIGCGVYFIAGYKSNSNLPADQGNLPLPTTVVPAASATVDSSVPATASSDIYAPTSQDKNAVLTYTNQPYAFQFQYPGSASILEQMGFRSVPNLTKKGRVATELLQIFMYNGGSHVLIQLFSDPGKQDIRSWENEYQDMFEEIIGSYKLDKLDAIQMSAFLIDHTDYIYAAANGPYVYYIDCPESNPNIPVDSLNAGIKLCQQILNSFKVTRDDSSKSYFSCVPKPSSVRDHLGDVSQVPVPEEGYCPDDYNIVKLGEQCGGNLPVAEVCEQGTYEQTFCKIASDSSGVCLKP